MNWLEQAVEWLEDRQDDGDMTVLVVLGVVFVSWCMGWIG